MRIAFCGSQGTGKSTLVNILKGRYPEYAQHTNASRLLSQLPGFGINKNAGIIEQSIITGQFAVDVLSNSNLLADRSIIDSFAYAFTNDNLDQNDLNCLYNKFKDICYLYDYLFYIPIEFETEEDGVRDTNSHYRREVDKYILKLLEDTGVNYITLNGTVEERMKIIDENLP